MLEFIKVMTNDKYWPKIWNKNKIYNGLTPCVGLYGDPNKSPGGQKALDFKINLTRGPIVKIASESKIEKPVWLELPSKKEYTEDELIFPKSKGSVVNYAEEKNKMYPTLVDNGVINPFTDWKKQIKADILDIKAKIISIYIHDFFFYFFSREFSDWGPWVKMLDNLTCLSFSTVCDKLFEWTLDWVISVIS